MFGAHYFIVREKPGSSPDAICEVMYEADIEAIRKRVADRHPNWRVWVEVR